MENTGYRIADFEQALPEGAVIDEVRYNARSGLKVNCVIGTVKVKTPVGAGAWTDEVKMVIWNEKGMCHLRCSGQWLPEFDLKLEGGV